MRRGLFPFAVTYVTNKARGAYCEKGRGPPLVLPSENTPAMRARRLEYGGCGEG